jgi:hypothetical protein
VWVDENAGADTTGVTNGAEGTAVEDITVTVEGEQYAAEVNFDIDDDGVDDTAIVEHADGSGQAFIDDDGDGAADEYIQLDSAGNVVQHAQFDQATGDWVAVPDGPAGGPHAGGTDPGGQTQTSADGGLTADLPDGEVQVGPATVDTDHDGVNDTAVVQDGSGNTIGFTDVDGDGEADVAVVIDPSGQANTYEHTGGGRWVEAGGDNLWDDDGDGGDGGAVAGEGRQPVEGVARIDPGTGQWISQN